MKMMKWTDEEVQIIKNNLDKSDKELAKLVNHNAASVKGKRQKLGLLKKETKKLWTSKDEAFLRDNYSIGLDELVKHFGTDSRRVYSKIVRMGLIEEKRHDSPLTDEEIQIVKDNFDKSDEEIAKLVNRRTIFITTKRRDLGLLRQTLHKQWTSEEETFLKDHSSTDLNELAKHFGIAKKNIYNKMLRMKLIKMVKSCRPWIDDEIQIVKDNLNKSDEEISKLINRSVKAVKSERTKLGLLRKKTNTPWTSGEEEFLKENCFLDLDELAKCLKMTKKRVYNKMLRMKLIETVEPNQSWTNDEIQIVKDNLDKSDKEIGKLVNRNAMSVKSKRKKLGLLKHEQAVRWTSEEKVFLKENYLLDIDELSTRLGMTKKRIRSKMYDMGLGETGECGVPWTTEEMNKLKEMHEYHSMSEICKAFPNRTFMSILGQRRKLPKPVKVEIRTMYGYEEILVNNRYVKHHRHAMEQYLGRELDADVCVHHLSFDHLDNRPGINLIALTRKQHGDVHGTVKKLIKPLMDAGYVKYDRTVDKYVVVECKTDVEFRNKIFNDFNKKADKSLDDDASNNADSVEYITQSLIKKYGYITSSTSKWTDEELNFIKDNPNLPSSVILKILSSRSTVSVKHKLHRLGYKIKKKKCLIQSTYRGYRLIHIDGKNIREHRHIMELYLGRRLLDTEKIHHISCVKDDNRLENLVLFKSNSAHRIAEASFNLCMSDLYTHGIVAYFDKDMSYILGENFVANDNTYKPDDNTHSSPLHV